MSDDGTPEAAPLREGSRETVGNNVIPPPAIPPNANSHKINPTVASTIPLAGISTPNAASTAFRPSASSTPPATPSADATMPTTTDSPITAPST